MSTVDNHSSLLATHFAQRTVKFLSAHTKGAGPGDERFPNRTTSVTRLLRIGVAALSWNESYGQADAPRSEWSARCVRRHVRDRFDLGRRDTERHRNGNRVIARGRGVARLLPREATAHTRRRRDDGRLRSGLGLWAFHGPVAASRWGSTSARRYVRSGRVDRPSRRRNTQRPADTMSEPGIGGEQARWRPAGDRVGAGAQLPLSRRDLVVSGVRCAPDTARC